MILDFSTVMFLIGVGLCGAALGWAAISDAKRFVIPNRVSLLIFAGYLCTVPRFEPELWLTGLAAGMLILAVGVFLFAFRMAGGGDVKLAAAIGLWAGAGHFGPFVMVASAASLLLAIAMLTTPLPRLFGRRISAIGMHSAAQPALRAPMPFALPLAAGGFWVLRLHLMSLV
ncbi:A24 family peptidase [Altericroceibacterium xinjiangense]|uniref:A24 family peptidase n=1 Tax=Altericroceibacterium xinjiangense TaxID=762261 RepID=UPI000F7D5B74|nr:prepilin peptidase [Altericroceibacterium xinjiangense]